ncbi:MAG: SusF/SusE family outer membrane protein [Duncaniella sp.]|nr:SusF/SusE family outer membrane protein [Duncaniella sp.]
MKKSIFYGLSLVLSLGIVACDNYEEPNPKPQTNPQESVFESASIELNQASGDQAINLNEVNENNGKVQLAQLGELAEFPEGYDLMLVAELSANEAFSNVAEVATTIDNNIVYANPDALDAGFHTALNSIAPVNRTVYIRYKGYATQGNTKIRLGGPDVYFCPMNVVMRPFDPDFVIEDKYYLIGTCSDGSINAKAIEMTNSGASPYDDPMFSVVVDITAAEAAAGYEWAVIPASTLAAGSGIVYGPEYDDDLYGAAGNLKAYETVGVFGVIEEENKHLITVNMRPGEGGLHAYTWILAIPNLYTPGGANGWNQAASDLLYTSNYVDYEGFIHASGEFKFTSAPDWNHTNYGYASDGKLSTDGGAGNIPVAAAGLYYAKANISALTYSLSPAITTIGIIGDATENGWDASTPLTPSEDFLTWTGTVTLKGGEFKFRANDSWDVVNLGGNLEFLSTDGGAPNIPSPGEGTYELTLNLGSYPYTATLTKK